MIETKRVIRHAVLNLLTVIGMTLAEQRISLQAKKRADDYVKLIALLISHESIFLGKKPKFLVRNVDLNMTLDLIKCIYTKEINERKMKVTMPKGKCMVDMDSHYTKEALQQIFRNLLYLTKEVNFVFSTKAKKLTIDYVPVEPLSLEKKNLVKCLDDVDSEHGREIAFQLALELFELHKIPVIFTKNKIAIAFK